MVFKKCGFTFLFFLMAALVSIGYYVNFLQVDKATERSELNIPIMMFLQIRDDLNGMLRGDTNYTLDIIREKWDEINSNNKMYATKAIFDTNGDVVLLSEKLDIAIYLSRDKSTNKKWICKTYPSVDFKSICSKL